MKLVSVNTGLPREVTWHPPSSELRRAGGRIVTTAIFKQPVAGRVALRKLNLDGDRQADLAVHGGEHKAVYCYPLAHYGYWKKELPGRELPMGMFGENFTIEGSAEGSADDGKDALSGGQGLEDSVHLGDRFSIGTAEVVVTQPRLPCYKLGIRFGSDDMVKRFLASGRTGFYVAVLREGEVGAGDEIKLIARDPSAVSVSEITRLYVAKRFGEAEISAVRRALGVKELPESWKEYFRERLRTAGSL
jgi:MOSC domain-containing protein YiiM